MPKLYIVPTPIGNLEDITLRAIRILKEVDFILAEDTRVSGKLLSHFEINTPMLSHHKFNEHKAIHGITEKIASGFSYALISDAGTPGISDPGFLLVRECLKNNIEVECLPGATAFIPALVNAGLPTDRFYFEGFLPQKKGRQTRLEFISQLPHTIVLYESPFRLVKTLEQLLIHCGKERQVSISRELSKIYEETIRGSLSEVISIFKTKKIKGEIVIILEGKLS
jgi:16S rRNA (cytidine1402-2'-O)-methyltransferase